MKNLIYSFLVFSISFLISYPQVFSISGVIILNIIIVFFWTFLILTKKEYSILFCFIGYLHPLTGIDSRTLNDGFSGSILFIALLIFSCIILKIWIVPWQQNSKLGRLIGLFILYQLLISILPNLLNGNLSLPVLMIEKDQFLGLLFFFPGYYLGIKHYKNTILFLTYFGLFFTIYYFLVLFKIFAFIDINSSFVVSGTEQVMRYGLDIRQIFKLFIYAIPIAFLLKSTTKVVFIIVGLSCYLFMLISFARNELIYTTLGIFLSLFFILKYDLRSNSFFIRFLILSLIILSGSFMYISYTIPNFNLIAAFNSSINASNSSGFFSLNHRFNEIVPNQINLLFSSVKNLVLGVGYDDIWRKNTLSSNDLGIWDVPLTGSLTKFGIIGFSIYMAIYSQIFKEIFRFLKLLKQNKSDLLLRPNFNEYAFSIVLTSYFITSMVFRTYYVTWELTINFLMIEFAFLIGLYIASVQKLTSDSLPELLIENS
jgi:hypothetical protein